MPTKGGSNCNCDVQNGGKKAQKAKKAKKANGAKKPTPYNLFMKKEIQRVKKNDPTLDHKEAFKQAANNWSKNKK